MPAMVGFCAIWVCISSLELELELIQTQMAQKPMLRAEVGMRVVAQTKQVRNDSGGRGALAKFLGKFAKIEEFVGVAHSAEQ